MRAMDILLNKIDELNTKIKNTDKTYDKIQYAYQMYPVLKAIESVSKVADGQEPYI